MTSANSPKVGYYQMTVRERHLDVFGHVNNATYLELFEEARWDHITNRGYSLNYILEVKKGPIILEAQVQFRKELSNLDHITISTELLSYQGKIGKMKQVIFKEDGTESATAHFTFALFDLTERKLIPPTPEWKKGIGLTDA